MISRQNTRWQNMVGGEIQRQGHTVEPIPEFWNIWSTPNLSIIRQSSKIGEKKNKKQIVQHRAKSLEIIKIKRNRKTRRKSTNICENHYKCIINKHQRKLTKISKNPVILGTFWINFRMILGRFGVDFWRIVL